MQNSPLPYSYVKEQINRQNKFIHVVDTFRPSVNRIPVTSKFWAKHDATLVRAGEEMKHESYMRMVEDQLMGVPKSRLEAPAVESHNYGWFTEPFVLHDRRDRSMFHHPKPRNEITQVGEKIFAEKVTERPKWNGVPFKLR